MQPLVQPLVQPLGEAPRRLPKGPRRQVGGSDGQAESWFWGFKKGSFGFRGASHPRRLVRW